MRRLVVIVVALTGLAVAAVAAASGGGGDYEVRAIFDNGGFLVKGEDVRIAGAKVGEVASVDVTLPGEEAHADGSPDPGKAVAVLRIDDPGFQDFRQDASCLIRPQSLLGEKYVDCSPTQPRAPGTPLPPPLSVVPDGQPGAGQHFLPLESNGKQVDLDLVQDIQRLPYAERFRLILNDLGAGLAGRGHELKAVVRRADPALRETDQVLSVLAHQNHQLAQLASNSDTVLAPLARERRHVAGFIDSAGATAQATAERAGDLESGIHKLPGFLTQLRSTMVQLRSFALAGTPVISDLGAAAPSLTRATTALGPFARSARRALVSLGRAAEPSGPKLRHSTGLLRDIKDLAHSTPGPASDLRRLLASLRKTGGNKQLMNFIYNTTGSLNGFDNLGHFVRAELQATPCVEYRTIVQTGCEAQWQHRGGKAKAGAHTASIRDVKTLLDFAVGRQQSGTGAGSAGGGAATGTGGTAAGTGGTTP